MKKLNQRSRRSSKLGPTLLVALISVGCGVDSQSLGTIQEMVSTVSKTKLNAGPESTTAADSLVFIESTFSPPYPDREDAFVFPGEADEMESSDSSLNSVSEVKVLGFANVGEQRVFLSARSVTKSMRAGEKFEGIEVLSIQPPAVELKMGTLVWTATMFDRSR